METGLLAKCDMCVDRVHNGLKPACVKTCPTGAMNFGDREKMTSLAKKRLEEVKIGLPDANLIGLEDLRVFYLLGDHPGKYHIYASAKVSPPDIDRKTALKKTGKSILELSKDLLSMKGIAG